MNSDFSNFIRFFPIFRLFPTFRLLDSTTLVWCDTDTDTEWCLLPCWTPALFTVQLGRDSSVLTGEATFFVRYSQADKQTQTVIITNPIPIITNVILIIISRLPCYVFCICLLTNKNKYQKYKSVELGDELNHHHHHLDSLNAVLRPSCFYTFPK